MQIDISLVRLRHTMEELSRISKALNVKSKVIEQVSLEIGAAQDSAMRVVARTLRIESENLSAMVRRMDVMRLSLERILKIYIQAERLLEDSSEGFRVEPGKVSVVSAEKLISSNVIAGKFAVLN